MEFRETTRGRNLLKTGVIIQGFCNGYFGRDSYEDKKILSWGEEDDRIWIVAIEDDLHRSFVVASDVPAEVIDTWEFRELLPGEEFGR